MSIEILNNTPLSKIFVSKYAVSSLKLETNVSLLTELENFKSGFYKEKIDACRAKFNDGDLMGYKNLKSKLPALTFCGIFQNGHSTLNLRTYNNVFIIDVDKIPLAILPTITTAFAKDKYIFAYWLSPSGNGIKALIKTNSNPLIHKLVFDQLCVYFSKTYEINIDKSGGDISRLCYVSYDKSLNLKEEFSTFEPNVKDYPDRVVVDKKEPLTNHIINDQEYQKVAFYKTEGRNKRHEKETILKIIKFLTKNSKSITSNYSDWYRVAIAIANTFTFDIGLDFYLKLCRLDGPLHDEYKSKKVIEYAYRNRKDNLIKLGTIIHLAKEKGFKTS